MSIDEQTRLKESHIHNVSLEGKRLRSVYEMGPRIGEGGMSWVYRARHTILGNEVAVKILRFGFENESEQYERFLREARVLYKLNHRHIVRIYELIQEDGLVGYVQEWCDEGNVKEWLDAHPQMSTLDALKQFFFPLLDAVAHAHDQGVVHRDIKPHNVLLTRQGGRIVPKLSDFGLVKELNQGDFTRTGTIMGTVHYMSPEQFEESKAVDTRADIYSLGVVLYELATRRLPYTGRMPSLGLKILKGQPPLPKEAPQALQGVILRSMKRQPDERFATVDAFKEALVDACESSYPSFSFESYAHEQEERSLNKENAAEFMPHSVSSNTSTPIHWKGPSSPIQSPAAFASTIDPPAFHTFDVPTDAEHTRDLQPHTTRPQHQVKALIAGPRSSQPSFSKTLPQLSSESKHSSSSWKGETYKESVSSRLSSLQLKPHRSKWFSVLAVLIVGCLSGWVLASFLLMENGARSTRADIPTERISRHDDEPRLSPRKANTSSHRHLARKQPMRRTVTIRKVPHHSRISIPQRPAQSPSQKDILVPTQRSNISPARRVQVVPPRSVVDAPRRVLQPKKRIHPHLSMKSQPVRRIFRTKRPLSIQEKSYRRALRLEKDRLLYLARAEFTKGCKLNHMKSCERLVFYWLFGRGGVANLTQALRIMVRMCKQDKKGKECIHLKHIFMLKRDVSYRNPKQMKQFARRLCSMGSPAACTLLGQILYKRSKSKRELRQAALFLLRGCRDNNPQGCYLYSRFLHSAHVLRDRQKAYELLRRSCSLRWAEGCYTLGLQWSRKRGHGACVQARKAFLKACDLGLKKACHATCPNSR